jgi:hypothetical protein
VDAETGLPLTTADAAAEDVATVLVRGTAPDAPALELPRLDRPPRIAPGTDEALLEPVDAEPPAVAPPEE